MTEASRTSRNSHEDYYTPDTEVTGWAGWVAFAGIMMIMLGFFQAIEGLVALFNDGFYLVRPDGLVVNVDYNAWGWTHLVLGAVAIAVGFGLMVGNTFARVAGIAIALISAILNLVFISAYPVWSTIVIAVDVIVIYAIVVHGRELKSTG
jgi:tetrahydromethanopterin S-methyltransferase subunit F